jgi:serine/threonine-protein kinase
MIRVLTEPPDEAPPEVNSAIEAGAQKQIRMGARIGGAVMLTWFLFLPLFWWMGMRDWLVIACVLGPIGVSATLSMSESRRATVRPWVQAVTYLATTFAMASASRIFGPFILVPTLAATYAVSVNVHPHVGPRRVVLVLSCLAIIVPVLLEQAGILPRTVSIHEGALVIRTLGTLREGPTITVLVIAGVAMTVSASLFISRMRDALSHAEQRLHLHAWHVQRMMPEGLPTRSQLLKSVPNMRPVRPRRHLARKAR